jgi:hypothetical protein
MWRAELLTVDGIVVFLQYAGYLLLAGLLAFVLVRRRVRRLLGVSMYLGLVLAIDGISRPIVLYSYGFRSHAYAYFFWLTDVLLALGAFLLICFFFHRACALRPQMWQYVRLILTFVLILVVGVSLLALSKHYSRLFTLFIVEFQQNLYFTCLVLNTLLYLLIQQLKSADEELSLLVCGLGIQFAGPAANFALVYLTRGQAYPSMIYQYLGPLCYIGMLLTWFYAVTWVPQPRSVLSRETPAELAVATGREA